jgi:hypothetical protein
MRIPTLFAARADKKAQDQKPLAGVSTHLATAPKALSIDELKQVGGGTAVQVDAPRTGW